MNILENDICKLQVISNDHLIKDNVDIITAVFFKRDQYYKNFDIYIKGLHKIMKFINEYNHYHHNINNPITFAIFIDENILKDVIIMKIINDNKYTVPILFRCHKYMKGDYHVDLFGTFVRFFPMYDFPNNPFNMVLCIDIDLKDEDYIKLKFALKHRIDKVLVAGRIWSSIGKNKKLYAYAGFICYNIKKGNHKILIDFIQNADKVKSKGFYGKRLTTFGYGIDEIFLNDHLITSLDQYCVMVDYQISHMLYNSEDEIKNKNISTKILNKMNGTTDNNINKALKMIDKKTYNIDYKTKENDEISKIFSKIIKYTVKHKKKWLKGRLQKFVYDNLLNIIYANLVICMNQKNKVIGVEKHDVIYDSDHK